MLTTKFLNLIIQLRTPQSSGAINNQGHARVYPTTPHDPKPTHRFASHQLTVQPDKVLIASASTRRVLLLNPPSLGPDQLTLLGVGFAAGLPPLPLLLLLLPPPNPLLLPPPLLALGGEVGGPEGGATMVLPLPLKKTGAAVAEGARIGVATEGLGMVVLPLPKRGCCVAELMGLDRGRPICEGNRGKGWKVKLGSENG